MKYVYFELYIFNKNVNNVKYYMFASNNKRLFQAKTN